MSNNFLDLKILLKEVSYAHRDYIYLIKNTVKNSNIVKYFSNYIKYILKCHLFL